MSYQKRIDVHNLRCVSGEIFFSHDTEIHQQHPHIVLDVPDLDVDSHPFDTLPDPSLYTFTSLPSPNLRQTVLRLFDSHAEEQGIVTITLLLLFSRTLNLVHSLPKASSVLTEIKTSLLMWQIW